MLVDKKYDLVFIGHICHDIVPDGHVTGGAAFFGSVQACKMKKEICVLTSIKEDDPSLMELGLMNVDIINQVSHRTTCFKNQYINNQRVQYLYSCADHIRSRWINNNIPVSKMVMVCPIADEVDVSILADIKTDLLACSIQGWLREVDQKGKIVPKHMDWEKLRFADIVFLSYDDIEGHESVIDLLSGLGNIIVITNADKGADVFFNGQRLHFPSAPIIVKNPTGAGDIFSTGFILNYYETNNLAHAARYAHMEAALFIRHTPGNTQ